VIVLYRQRRVHRLLKKGDQVERMVEHAPAGIALIKPDRRIVRSKAGLLSGCVLKRDLVVALPFQTSRRCASRRMDRSCTRTSPAHDSSTNYGDLEGIVEVITNVPSGHRRSLERHVLDRWCIAG
jgi:hypothetical protein